MGIKYYKWLGVIERDTILYAKVVDGDVVDAIQLDGNADFVKWVIKYSPHYTDVPDNWEEITEDEYNKHREEKQ